MGRFNDNSEFLIDAIQKHLLGGSVVGIAVDSDEGGCDFGRAVGLIIKKGEWKQTAWVSCDPEGNGPGFLHIEPFIPEKPEERTPVERAIERATAHVGATEAQWCPIFCDLWMDNEVIGHVVSDGYGHSRWSFFPADAKRRQVLNKPFADVLPKWAARAALGAWLIHPEREQIANVIRQRLQFLHEMGDAAVFHECWKDTDENLLAEYRWVTGPVSHNCDFPEFMGSEWEMNQ